MTDVAVRWRPSGGRGEYEFVPSGSLTDRKIRLSIEALHIEFDAEVFGAVAQGKPRLRKRDSRDRTKLHLPPLVLAIARLPQPRREDTSGSVTFPLESKGYLIDEIEFEAIEDDGEWVTLAPLGVRILNSDVTINLVDRYRAIADDWKRIEEIRQRAPILAEAIVSHREAVEAGINKTSIAMLADTISKLQNNSFGATNYGAVSVLIDSTSQNYSETDQDIYGIEGNTLTRVHIYKERDRALVAKAKKHYKNKWGKLHCEACGLSPDSIYGERGDSCIEAHHKTPIEKLLPDSVTRADDLAMLCASCHRIVHSCRPILTVDAVLKAA